MHTLCQADQPLEVFGGPGLLPAENKPFDTMSHGSEIANLAKKVTMEGTGPEADDKPRHPY